MTPQAYLHGSDASSLEAAPAGLPLFVDLDGTLLVTDSLHECLLARARHRPKDLLKVPLWLLRGRAFLKAQLASDDVLDVKRLPYNSEVRAYLISERSKGRRIYLATAANERLARRIANHVGVFDGVIASDGRDTLKSEEKLAAIQRIARAAFAYAGNSRADLPIWSAAASTVVVNAPPSIERRVRRTSRVEKVVRSTPARLPEVVRAMRVYQWLKNLLVFVPVLTAFHVLDVASLSRSIFCFIAFSLCASATYIANDLLDLQADRNHPRKRLRPFAAGLLSVPMGVGVAIAAMVTGGAIALSQSVLLFAVVAAYVCGTTAYSWVLKSRVLIDVVCLASLYIIRIIGGAVAIDVTVSVWLLALALFVFLSLALVKRCVELKLASESGMSNLAGRGYLVDDLKVLWSLGTGTAVSSVLVLALFIYESDDIKERYATPWLLWLVVVALFFWLGRIWIKTSRGELTDDPIVFALRDFGSQLTIGMMVLITLLAHFIDLQFVIAWLDRFE